MSWRLLFILLLSLILSTPLIAKEKLFLEIGPRYSVSMGPGILSDYWGNGWGVGASFVYRMDDNLAVVSGLSYRTFPYDEGVPFSMLEEGFIEYEGNDFVPLEGRPGPFGEWSSILEASLAYRLYGNRINLPHIRPFFSMGFGYQREYVGDIILFVRRYDYDNDTYDLDPYEWQGKNYSRGTIFLHFGVGTEIFYYRSHPLVFEVGGQFGSREGSSTYLPMKINFVF
jgi:hypothetical protein